MRFNLKYLILPLSIMVCINNNCMNAMENIIYEVNQNQMSWVTFEKVLTSFQNNEQLNDIQIDFINRIANEISHNADINNWRSLMIDRDILYQTISQLDQVNNINLSNRDLLFYLEKTAWVTCLYDIPNNNNDNNM